jgi:hypothetical protein
MAVEKQNADGSESILGPDGNEVARFGGRKQPAGTSTNTPDFPNGSTLRFQIGGGTDTAGALLSWQNTLGYDILVYSHQLNVTTHSTAACTVSLGQTATNGTTLASNMISGQSVASNGAFNGGALSILVPQNTWITGSTASGASAGLVAVAYFEYVPV